VGAVVTARAFLAMQRRWAYADHQALRALVERNSPMGSELGREGYIVMRDLAAAVGALLMAEADACTELGMPVEPGIEHLVRRW